MITNSYGRTINYLRLAVTDRCNLRCTYCMPKDGLDWLPRRELMTYEMWNMQSYCENGGRKDPYYRICCLFHELIIYTSF